jgi:hypothetical protein
MQASARNYACYSSTSLELCATTYSNDENSITTAMTLTITRDPKNTSRLFLGYALVSRSCITFRRWVSTGSIGFEEEHRKYSDPSFAHLGKAIKDEYAIIRDKYGNNICILTETH